MSETVVSYLALTDTTLSADNCGEDVVLGLELKGVVFKFGSQLLPCAASTA